MCLSLFAHDYPVSNVSVFNVTVPNVSVFNVTVSNVTVSNVSVFNVTVSNVSVFRSRARTWGCARCYVLKSILSLAAVFAFPTPRGSSKKSVKIVVFL